MAKSDKHNDRELLKNEISELDQELLGDVTGGNSIPDDDEEDPDAFRYVEPITVNRPVNYPAQQNLSKKKNRAVR